MINIKKDIIDIIKIAKRRNGFRSLCCSLDEKALGTISVSIRNFKNIGLLIDLDLPFELTEDKKIKLKKYIDYVHQDIESKGFKEEIKISKNFIVCPVYKGDENDILTSFFDILGLKVTTKNNEPC